MRTGIQSIGALALLFAASCAGNTNTNKPPAPKPAPFALDPDEVARVAADPDQRSAIKADLDTYLSNRPDALDDTHKAAFESCEGQSCLELPRAAESSGHDGTSAAAMVPLWLKACHDGAAEGCMQIARAYQSTGLTPEGTETLFKDRSKADPSFFFYQRRACDLDLEHCTLWVDHFLGEDKPDTDVLPIALERAEGLCGSDKAMACAAISKFKSRLSGDLDGARSYMKRACDLARHSNRYCGLYGTLLLKGEGGEVDEAGALTALERSCGPDKPAWKKNCQADDSPIGESCNIGFRALNSAFCVELAGLYEKQGQQAKATRVYTAMCDSLLVIEDDHLAQACDKAKAAHKAAGADQKLLVQLHIRACEVEEDLCSTRATKGETTFAACLERETACKAEVEGK